MRKIFTVFTLIITILLVGCGSNSTNTNNTSQVSLDTNKSMVLSTYLASGLLSSSESSDSLMNMSSHLSSDYKVITLTDTTTTEEPTLEIETELDEVNQYFDKLKVFMDQGVESVLNVTEQTSTIEGYDYEITYSIEDVTYTIYYSFVEAGDTTTTEEEVTTSEEVEEELDEEENEEENEEEFHLVGLVIINGVEYDLIGANEVEEDESKMWFETIDTSNTGNYVHVEIKEEEGEQKFEITTVIDGIEEQAEIKFEQEDDETKVELKLVQGEEESSYEFKKEIDGDEITYKFEYQIGEVSGEVEISEITDSEGNVTYKYDIEEDGRHKEIEKDEDDVEEEDEEETTTTDETQAV